MDTIDFMGFFLRILRILLHLKFPSNSKDLTTFSYKTTPHKRSENSPSSRNLVTAERKRRGQGGVMWTESHKWSDANHVGWINLIQDNTTHCAKLGLMRAQEIYIDTTTAQVTAPDLFGGFSFRVWKNWRGRIHESRGGFMEKNIKTEFGQAEFRGKVRRIGDVLPQQI